MRTTNVVEVGCVYRDLSTHWRKGTRTVEVTRISYAYAFVKTYVEGVQQRSSMIAVRRLANKSQFTLLQGPPAEAEVVTAEEAGA